MYALRAVVAFWLCGCAGETTKDTVGPDPYAAPVGAAVLVDPAPGSPASDDGQVLGWSTAPVMDAVTAVANRDSVVLVLPVVAGAIDFRVVTLPAGMSVVVDDSGHEKIEGATLFCAGYRQVNGTAGPRPLLTQVEVTGLVRPTRLVVEALDRPCPFPGVIGAVHADLDVENPAVEPAARGVFSVVTSDEVRARYGSVVWNGHGRGTSPGRAASTVSPKILARTAIEVAPRTSPAPTAFFDEFGASSDTPVRVGDVASDRGTGQRWQSTRWSVYSFGAALSQVFLDGGRLHQILADAAQTGFASQVAYPRRPVALDDTSYLHVTFEVGSSTSPRRGWWLSLCGAAGFGTTLDDGGALSSPIVPTPFFMDSDGQNPSVAGWNCLQIFPRAGWPFALGPDGKAPQSEVRILVNRADAADRASVVDVSPQQYSAVTTGPAAWFRRQDAGGKLTSAPLLDDQQLISPRTHFDVFVRRDRVVLYVNGEQRICNGLPSGATLTMAEGALGFGQWLFHSAAERQEFGRAFWDRTGDRYVLENTPFVDERTWDNVGFTEHSELPAGFDETVCYVAASN